MQAFRPETNALPIIDDCEKTRLTDRRTIGDALELLHRRGFGAEDAVAFLVRVFFVDLDELSIALAEPH